MSSGAKILNIHELNLDLINPSPQSIKKKVGGSKLVFIGKPGTGKSRMIASVLYNKRSIIPVGLVMSGTEDSSPYYENIFPKTFIYNNYDEAVIEKFIQRQKLAKANIPNAWAVLLIDDCTDSPSVFKKPLQQSLYKYGRHWEMLYILSLQYCMDVMPSIRTSVDGVFILRDPILKNRKSLYENYASIIPDFSTFCSLMDQITDDWTALYIHNATNVNEWQDCVFWYKADPKFSDKFKFGCPDYWKFHNERYDPNYQNPI